MNSAKKNIETPEQFYSYWQQYKEYCKNNPYVRNDFKNSSKDGIQEVFLKTERPITLEGFQGWLSANGILRDFKDYMSNKEGRYSDFVDVVEWVRAESKGELLSGGLAKVFDPALIARYLGIAQVVENKITTDDKMEIKELTAAQLEQLKSLVDATRNKG